MISAKNTKATQDFVPIREVRDNIVVMKDGGLRAIVMAASINFSLKSEEEQTSIILQFQNFLNSLNFSVQICIQSRRLNIKPYLAMLEERERAQEIELMKIQTREYIQFIKKFTEDVAIMEKHFFVVIPYAAPIVKDNKGAGAQTFEENVSQLTQRVEVVESGLSACGVRVAELGTKEIIDLYYKSFNPGELSQAAGNN